MNGWVIFLILLGFPLSWTLTGLMRRYALSHGVVDVPNERSSHAVVKPRGGGVAIAAAFLLGIAALAALGVLPTNLVIALGGGGVLVAGVGWLDDQRGLSPISRAVVHLMAAAWAVYWLGGLPFLEIGSSRLPLHLFGAVLAVIGVAWLINLFNFMDGIDGIAGIETVSAGILGGIFAALSGAMSLALACWLLSFATGGFLVWNWPPAKIFMGDVGSGFLGYSFAVMALSSENLKTLPLLIWIVLLGVFIVDATATLIRRVRQGDRWYEAHRTHAYQYAVQAGFTHGQVTVAVLVLNLGLGLIGTLMYLWPQWLLEIAVVALGLLIWLRESIVRRFAKVVTLSIRSTSL